MNNNCINCGSDYKPLFNDYVVCKKCGLYKNTKYSSKEELRERLKDFLLSASRNKNTEEKRLNKAQKQMDVLNKYLPNKGKVFDVAAAGGFFLKKARENGWDIDGNEISIASREWAKNNYNIILKEEYFTDDDIDENYYDAVVFWNSFEHMHDPIEVLKKTYYILKEGGLIYIRVPNKSQEMLRKHSEKLHSFEFNKNNLNSLLEKNGFEKIFIKDVDEQIPSMDLLYKKIIND